MSYVFRRQQPLIASGLRRVCGPPPWSFCPALAIQVQSRSISASPRWGDNKYDEAAKKLNQKGLDEHEQEVKVRQRQIKVPWHRENADKPPVGASKSELESTTKGRGTYSLRQF